MGIHIIDLTIFILYLIFMLGVGFYFLKKNKTEEDYYIGGRSMKSGHIGLSVVATDVGGGFSIGLGGLGFSMGISGSWMLFTGLLGAWLSAVFLIPKVYPLAKKNNFLTFPDFLSFHYSKKVTLAAAIVSLIGYIGFTGSQMLAGAKLASAMFPEISINNAAIIMGGIAVVYTVMGGFKAVVYTDTIQWVVLMIGLIFVGIPICYVEIGGIESINKHLPGLFLSLSNISFIQIFNWFITIVPIWFVGMTLYQRIYACKDEKTAKKAWFIAGLFEWPIMAFMGVILGLFSRVAFEMGLFTEFGFPPNTTIDAELGLPILLSKILPIGILGIMISAYFSAIMSTADSCLMAASGNFLTDIFKFFKKKNSKNTIIQSQITTLIIGIIAVFIATMVTSVLDLMLYSYSFMVSGLLMPVIGTLMYKKPNSNAAFASIIFGGFISLFLIIGSFDLPFGLDANFFGIILSGLTFVAFQYFYKSKTGSRNQSQLK